MSQIELTCATCGNKFKRWKSKVRSRNAFCSFKCKNKGMSLKLTAPMREGTGCNVDIQLIKRKYYKYKQSGLSGISVWEFVDLIKKGKCYYCGSKKELGFDRVDNKKGHSLDNYVICCHLCNMTRGDRFTVEQMLKIGQTIKEIRNEQ